MQHTLAQEKAQLRDVRNSSTVQLLKAKSSDEMGDASESGNSEACSDNSFTVPRGISIEEKARRAVDAMFKGVPQEKRNKEHTSLLTCRLKTAI